MIGRTKTTLIDIQDNNGDMVSEGISAVNQEKKIQPSGSLLAQEADLDAKIKIEAEYTNNSHSNGSSSNGHSSHSSDNSKDRYRKKHRRFSYASKFSTPRGSNASSSLSYFSANERERHYDTFTRRATAEIIYLIRNKGEHQVLGPLQEGIESIVNRKELLLNNTAAFLEENLQDLRMGQLIETLSHKPVGDNEEEINVIADKKSMAIADLLQISSENIINAEHQLDKNKLVSTEEDAYLNKIIEQNKEQKAVQKANSKEAQEDLREWFKDIMLFHLSQITVFLLGSARLTSKESKSQEITKAFFSASIANIPLPGASALKQIVGTGLTTFFTKKAENKTHKTINNLSFPNAEEIGKFSEILSEILFACFPKNKLLSLRDLQSTAKMCGFFSSISSAFFNFASHNSFADVFEKEKESFIILLNPAGIIGQAYNIDSYKNSKEITYAYAFAKYVQDTLAEKRGIELFAKEHEKQLYKALTEKLQITSSDIQLTKENIKSILARLEDVQTAEETVKTTKAQVEKCYDYLDFQLRKQESLDRYQDEGIKRLSITVNDCKRIIADISQCQGKTNLVVNRLTTVQEEYSKKLDSTSLRVEQLDKKLEDISLNIEQVSQEFVGVNTQLAAVKVVLSTVGTQLEKVTTFQKTLKREKQEL